MKFKKSGPVSSPASWEHQHPLAPGRDHGVVEQAKKKLEQAVSDEAKALGATLKRIRAEHDFNLKKAGKKKYKSVDGFLIDVETGIALTPEQYLARRHEVSETFGYYMKKRAAKQAGRPFKMKHANPVEELAVECPPWIAFGLEKADAAGVDVGTVAKFIFDGLVEEFERVTGFKVIFRARHPDEGILHDQLLWVKTDGHGKKLGLRPNSTRWSDLQFLNPALLGSRRWMNFLGREALGEEKAAGIDRALAERFAQCRGLFPVPPDVALADFVDARCKMLRQIFPELTEYLDRAEKDYRAEVEEKLGIKVMADEKRLASPIGLTREVEAMAATSEDLLKCLRDSLIEGLAGKNVAAKNSYILTKVAASDGTVGLTPFSRNLAELLILNEQTGLLAKEVLELDRRANKERSLTTSDIEQVVGALHRIASGNGDDTDRQWLTPAMKHRVEVAASSSNPNVACEAKMALETYDAIGALTLVEVSHRTEPTMCPHH